MSWEPSMCERPSVEVPAHLLARAQEAVVAGIALLQQTQQIAWRSIAADAMREELYAAIQLLRSIDAELAEARRDLGSARVAMDGLMAAP